MLWGAPHKRVLSGGVVEAGNKKGGASAKGRFEVMAPQSCRRAITSTSSTSAYSCSSFLHRDCSCKPC